MSTRATLFDPASTEEVRSQYEKCRYVALEGFLEPGLVSMLSMHVKAQVKAKVLAPPEGKEMPNSLEASSDPLMENVLRGLTPRLEELIGKALHPTYAFVRVYRKGDRLKKHRDREACEVSLSVNLAQDCEAPWPLWVEGPCGARAADLSPGDVLLYRGNECMHWRDEFSGEEFIQLFLHYVEQEGPHAGLRFDGRGALGTSRGRPDG